MLEKINAEVFLTVAELGSYRKAAEKLGYTQAGIKYIVDAMEEESGLTLFAREYGGVSLTQNGMDILPWVRQIKASQQALSERVNELVHLNSGKVKVMCFNSAMVYWIPGIVQLFHDEHPGIDVELIACDRFDQMEEAVYRREVDCGFFHLPVKKEIETITLSEEPMKVGFSKSHPFNDMDKVDPNVLAEYTYIGPPLTMDPGMREFFDWYGIHPKTGFATENDNAAIALASKGLGYCIYPGFVFDRSGFPLKTAELTKPLVWELGIGVRSFATCSKACTAFVDCTVRWISKHIRNT